MKRLGTQKTPDDLQTIPGVADVNSLGGEVRTFEVTPNPQLLAARGLALKEPAHQRKRKCASGRLL